MRTLLNDNDRAEVLDRLRRVRPDSARRWGTLSAARMLCHLADSLRVALGQIPVTPTHSFITRTVLKHRLCWKHLDHHLRQFGV